MKLPKITFTAVGDMLIQRVISTKYEGFSQIRDYICRGLEYLGVKYNAELNSKTRGEEIEISTPDSKVAVLTIPTNEELAICRETVALV